MRAIFGQLQPHPPLLDEMLASTYFALARDPRKSGSLIMGTGYRVIYYDMPPLGLAVRIIYESDANTVLLRAATRMPPENPE
ncbi:MAG: hypothetical protein ACJ8DJ_07510 [Gemmatimonadales bacterium]